MLWFRAIRRNYKDISETTSVFICEDHFDLENDMENYVRWKLMGGIKVMKETSIPHKFDCQQDRKRAFSGSPRQLSVKRMRKHLVKDALRAASTSGINDSVNLTKLDSSDEIKNVSVSQPQHHTEEFQNNNQKDIGVSVKPRYRSKQTQTMLKTSNQACSPFKIPTREHATSPVKIKCNKNNFTTKQLTLVSDESDKLESSCSNYEPLCASLFDCTSDESPFSDILQPN
ncbi:hypothetical protein FQR65_LT14057 [Abscondita terminalis]|nr:hypothetical protein FQR65_LT14057 [Abscondita terminalis]